MAQAMILTLGLIPGGTPSGGTGPTADNTTGNGNYVYLEASNGCNFQEAILITPCIDLSSTLSPELRFYYHMRGDDMGVLHVDLIADGQVFTDIITPVTGNQGTQWIQATADLSAHVGKTINIRFRGITGDGFESDIALDDIGVYENFVYTQDAALSAIVSPAFSVAEDCALSDSIDITVEVSNPGQNAIGFFPVSYQVDNQPIVTQVLGSIIQPSGVDTVTFNVRANISGLGAHTVKTWTSYPQDLFAGNDTMMQQINVVPGTSITGAFVEDLEGYGNCATTANCEATVCQLGFGWENLANGVGDDIDWRIDQNGTFSQNTGPSGDHTSGNGKYAYLEASGNPVCTNRTGILESPCLDLSGMIDPRLRIWYHMYGADMGELHFDIFFNGSWTEDFIPAIVGDQGNNWIALNTSLGLFVGSTIKIRIRGITGSGFASDMAIDDIEVFDGVSQPVANFVFSTPLCKGSAITFTDQSSGGSLNHSWNFGPNANPSIVTGPGPHVVVFNQGGPQNVWLAASNLAGTDTSFRLLDIDSLPNPGFTINVTGSSVAFSSTASNYLSIGYDFGDGASSNGNPNPTHNYPNSGLFVATQHLTNTCGVDSIQVPVLILGLKDYAAGSLGDRLQIYPNPVDQFLTLAWNGSSNLDFSYELTDLKGKYCTKVNRIRVYW